MSDTKNLLDVKYCSTYNSENRQLFFSELADYIKTNINPKTVLDLGCSFGGLVFELRNRGINAYGIDISKDDIAKADESVKPFCKTSSVMAKLPSGFPKSYDLVIALDLFDFLPLEDATTLIDYMHNLSEHLIFSSSSSSSQSDDPRVDVKPYGFWPKEFAKCNFFRLPFDDFNTYFPNLIRFKRAVLTPSQLVQNYEQLYMSAIKKSQSLSVISQNYKNDLSVYQNELSSLKKDCIHMENEVKRLSYALGISEKEIFSQNKKLKKLNDDVNRFQTAYVSVVDSGFWKVTAPIRKFLDLLKNKIKKIKSKHFLSIAINTLRSNGIIKTAQGFRHHLLKEKAGRIYLKNNLPTEKELEIQRNTTFERNVKVSILVPLFNTPEVFLREMIQSVLNQSYQNWELCLADGSDNEHSDVCAIVDEYVQKDKRIIYRKLEKNFGIAQNTNKCIEMATGDFIALFDHDDLLHESALFEVVKAINEQNADFVYTDEASFAGQITDHKFINFKPDFSPDTLRSYNYICHLSVFSRELLNLVGPFSSNYDGSQDYDMILRLTEKANNVYHIPRVLYYWRVHAASTANDIEAKPYCIDSAKRAIKDHLKRLGMNCVIEDSFIPTTYKVKYEIIGNPLISIIIPNKDHIEDLQKCILSIINKSTYKNFEIIIVENNSELDETFDYYKSISNMEKVKIAYYEGGFNYSLINNFAIDYCSGDYLLLLNNDVEVITPNWLEEMLMFAQRKDVGAVGAKLLYPDDTIQHAGVILGINGVAGHAHKGWAKDWGGYAGRITLAQNLSAVTAACLMLRRDVFDEVDGLDPTFAVAFNDIDFCLKIREKDYLIVYTPYAQLYHYESKSRGYEDTDEKRKRFQNEVLTFQKKWKKVLADGDPYYNKNLTLKHEDFSIKI